MEATRWFTAKNIQRKADFCWMAAQHNLSLGMWIAYANPHDICAGPEVRAGQCDQSGGPEEDLAIYGLHQGAGSLVGFACQVSQVAERAQLEFERGIASSETPVPHAPSVKAAPDPSEVMMATVTNVMRTLHKSMTAREKRDRSRSRSLRRREGRPCVTDRSRDRSEPPRGRRLRLSISRRP